MVNNINITSLDFFLPDSVITAESPAGVDGPGLGFFAACSGHKWTYEGGLSKLFWEIIVMLGGEGVEGHDVSELRSMTFAKETLFFCWHAMSIATNSLDKLAP